MFSASIEISRTSLFMAQSRRGSRSTQEVEAKEACHTVFLRVSLAVYRSARRRWPNDGWKGRDPRFNFGCGLRDALAGGKPHHN